MAKAIYQETLPHVGVGAPIKIGGVLTPIGKASQEKSEEEEKGARRVLGTSIRIPPNPNQTILDDANDILVNSADKLRDSEKTQPEIDAITKTAVAKKPNVLLYVVLVFILITVIIPDVLEKR